MNTGTKVRVRVRPNRNTAGLVALLLAIWYASASQNNGAAYLFGFVLAGVAAVSALHAKANLRGLDISCAGIEPVFAGGRQHVTIIAIATPGARHFAIRVKALGDGKGCELSEVAGVQAVRASLSIEAPERGCFRTLELRASSLYPFGLLTAAFVIRIPQERWVYPKAEGARAFPQRAVAGRKKVVGQGFEGDDFAGLRPYVQGEPQRHIDWKAVARGRELVIKQWAGETDETLRFQWMDTTSLADEARLSQLASWIVRAERLDRSYALAIPGTTIPVGRGSAHFHQCLRALAAFPRAEAVG